MGNIILTLPYPEGGHNDPPYQLWSLAAPRVRLGLVHYPYEFGHMGANYDLDPKKVWKFQLCLCYASCDEMIKNSPDKVGLTNWATAHSI